MSLAIHLSVTKPCIVFETSITANLRKMAIEAGLEPSLWGLAKLPTYYQAKDLIGDLKLGLQTLRKDPERFRKLNHPSGWGTYEQLVSQVELFLKNCEENPNATISTG